MKTNTRMIRINDEIKKEVSTILRGELKDPRVGVITSVLKVDTTNDLKYCKIFVSILGDDEKKEEVMQVLNRASGFVRSLIAKRINLRVTPEIKFILDDSLEYSFKIDKIIREIKDKSSLVEAWNASGRPYYDYSKYNTGRLDAFAQLDVRVDKVFYFRKCMLGIYVDLQNVTFSKLRQPDVLMSTGVIENPSAPPSEQRYKMKYIRQASGTLVPTLGVTVEF